MSEGLRAHASLSGSGARSRSGAGLPSRRWGPYVWKKRFGKMEALDVKKLRQLETENGRLKKLLAERDLELEVMKEISAQQR